MHKSSSQSEDGPLKGPSSTAALIKDKTQKIYRHRNINTSVNVLWENLFGKSHGASLLSMSPPTATLVAEVSN